MSGTPSLGTPPQRLTIETELVRRLIEDQFPHWAGLPVRPVADGGWDNRTFHLGSEMVVRIPSAAEYAQAVSKEQRWLPVLAADLPLPIPVPLAEGHPGPDYPHPWSVYRWLDGEPAAPDRIVDPVRFATDLADFLAALRRVEAADGPQPGIHNWFRGGPLRTYDANTQRSLTELAGVVDVGLAREIWTDALAAGWDGVDRWFHGDIAEGNLLLRDGQLAAVIDFGTCGVGDPACDLAIAWTLLTPDGRAAFRHRLSVDAASWARGRGWALWKTLATCSYTYDDPDDAEDFARARHTLGQIFADHRDQRRRHAGRLQDQQRWR
ncbi:MAG TPA: aminoglycoside phosphotransferase family protein [Microlunatus sp.]